MTIEITNRSGSLVPANQVTALLTFAFDFMELHPDCDLSLTFVADKEMEELHIKWMNEPGTTDVLSFPMDMPESREEPVILGDIVIDPIVAHQQAKIAEHSPEHEIYILAIHGLLHILGYDHADSGEEKVMFDLQESIVEKWESTQ